MPCLNIQTVLINEHDTHILFGDDLYVVVGLTHKMTGIGVADPLDPSKVRTHVAREEDEDLGDFLQRAMRAIPEEVYNIIWDTAESIRVAEREAQAYWIKNKRRLKFGT